MLSAMRSLARQGQDQLGRTHGDGYKIVHCNHRPGAAYSLYGEKILPNGRCVNKHLHMPGPFDQLAGIDSELAEYYLVWIGWEKYNPEFERLYDSPPGMDLPVGASDWYDTAFDGPRHWFVKFDSSEGAESFAAGLPAAQDDEPALCRHT